MHFSHKEINDSDQHNPQLIQRHSNPESDPLLTRKLLVWSALRNYIFTPSILSLFFFFLPFVVFFHPPFLIYSPTQLLLSLSSLYLKVFNALRSSFNSIIKFIRSISLFSLFLWVGSASKNSHILTSVFIFSSYLQLYGHPLHYKSCFKEQTHLDWVVSKALHSGKKKRKKKVP